MAQAPTRYWAWLKGKAAGPYSLDELKVLPDLTPETKLCPAGATKQESWLMARDFEDVAAALAARMKAKSAATSQAHDASMVIAPPRRQVDAEPQHRGPKTSSPQAAPVHVVIEEGEPAKCPSCGHEDDLCAPYGRVQCPQCRSLMPIFEILPTDLESSPIPTSNDVTQRLRESLGARWVLRNDLDKNFSITNSTYIPILNFDIECTVRSLVISLKRGRARGYGGSISLNDALEQFAWSAKEGQFYQQGSEQSNPCRTCGGVGSVPCSRCHGKGYFTEPHGGIVKNIDCWCGNGRESCGCEGGRVYNHTMLAILSEAKSEGWSIPVHEGGWPVPPDLVDEAYRSDKGPSICLIAGPLNRMADVLISSSTISKVLAESEDMTTLEATCRDRITQLAQSISTVFKDSEGKFDKTAAMHAAMKAASGGSLPIGSVVSRAVLRVRLVPCWRLVGAYRGHELSFWVAGTDLQIQPLTGLWRLWDMRKVALLAAVTIALLGAAVHKVIKPLLAVNQGPMHTKAGPAPMAGPQPISQPAAQEIIARPPRRLRRPAPEESHGTDEPLNKPPRKRLAPARAEDGDKADLANQIRALIASKQEAAGSGDISRLSELEREYRVLVKRFINQFGQGSWKNLRREIAEPAQPMASQSQDFDERIERKQESRVVTDPKTDDLVEEMKKRALRGVR